MALHSLYCADVPLRNCSLTLISRLHAFFHSEITITIYLKVSHINNILTKFLVVINPQLATVFLANCSHKS